jgi:hypothetical protein
MWCVLQWSLTACANSAAVVVDGQCQTFRTVSQCVAGSFSSENLRCLSAYRFRS